MVQSKFNPIFFHMDPNVKSNGQSKNKPMQFGVFGNYKGKPQTETKTVIRKIEKPKYIPSECDEIVKPLEKEIDELNKNKMLLMGELDKLNKKYPELENKLETIINNIQANASMHVNVQKEYFLCKEVVKYRTKLVKEKSTLELENFILKRKIKEFKAKVEKELLKQNKARSNEKNKNNTKNKKDTKSVKKEPKKDCPKGTVVNPITGICITIGKATYKKLVKEGIIE